MGQSELLPHLFRAEYRKIISVLSARFGIQYLEAAEDIAGETFLQATELWPVKGQPDNPVAWLYKVAQNKMLNHLKRDRLFSEKVSVAIRSENQFEEAMLDFSEKSINDSQLAMLFAVCNPVLSPEAQVALALNLLCGFGAKEIATAFLTNTEVIYKRLNRAKATLREADIAIETPPDSEIGKRLPFVLSTLYLLFSEGYYSMSQDHLIRQELCTEAMRLNYLLVNNPLTNKPEVSALLALMCFQSSRFEARMGENGEHILYDDQDPDLWNEALIDKGNYFLSRAASGSQLTKYHLEAGIASWHAHKTVQTDKWDNILQLYNHLLVVEYSPMAALNRTFALAKAHGKSQAIVEAEKLLLTTHPLYFSLLGYLYTDIDNTKALSHYRQALELTQANAQKTALHKAIAKLEEQVR